MDIGAVGVWWSGRWRIGDNSFGAAAELESLGFTAFWSSGGTNPGFSQHFYRLLSATSRGVIASGVINLWKIAPSELAAEVATLNELFPNRFLTGIGVSHATRAENYGRPYSAMVQYLDALDSGVTAIPVRQRVLAALGPKMLELAAVRSLGSHPYLVPADYIHIARTALGQRPLLAPAITVVLEPDARIARDRARSFLGHYLALPNYANNLRALGFGDGELLGGGSDRLIDALVCWGTIESVTEKIMRYTEAGADHVCIQALPGQEGAFPLHEYREISAALSL
ncbi:MAG: TIGR03620 family F420-dependent LLM class oxidoreductase [Acidimicrobiales bacterium]